MLRSNAVGTPVWFSIHDTNRSDKTFYIEISRYTSNHESTGRFSHTRSHDARGHSGERLAYRYLTSAPPLKLTIRISIYKPRSEIPRGHSGETRVTATSLPQTTRSQRAQTQDSVGHLLAQHAKAQIRLQTRSGCPRSPTLRRSAPIVSVRRCSTRTRRCPRTCQLSTSNMLISLQFEVEQH